MNLRTGLPVFILAGIVTTGWAQPSPPPEARQHSDACIKAYDLAEYQRAINECKAAYELYPAPLLLYSIAQANRKLGQAAVALEFYRKYVAKAPTGRQRPQAEDQIALLTPIVAAAERSRVAPPEGAGPDQAEQSSARRTSPIVAPVSGAAETQLHPAVVSGANDASARQPKSKRWVWGVVAGGAVVVALAVGLGVGLAPHSVSYASTTTTAGTVQW